MGKISVEQDYLALFQAHQSRAQALRTSTLRDRKRKLKRIKDWLIGHEQDICDALHEDLQKPPQESKVMEMYPLLTECRHAFKRLKIWAAPEPIESSLTFLGTRAYIHYEPKGTSLIISPWNYPLLLALGPVVSSLAAGNTVLLKPSEFTPAINKVIGKLFSDLFEANEVTMIEGGSGTASTLLQLPFDHIFFTGSPAVGKIVMEAASKNLTSVTLELGGKSPTIIDETANLKDAAEKIAWGKCTNAGQTCVAPDYLYVHESKREEFLELLISNMRNRYQNEEEYTGIIDSRHFDRISALFKDAREKGARLEYGGEMDVKKCRIQPTILTDISKEMKLMEEEIFGPLMPILFYNDLNEVISYINARPKPLALYLFSRNRRNRQRILKETSSGAVVFNDTVLQFGHPHLPMGGVNNSGIGKAHGKAGFQAFSHGKAVLKQRVGWTIVKMVYPPYSQIKNKMIDMMLKYF